MRTAAIVLAISLTPVSAVDAQVLSLGWGSSGSGNGQLNDPWGIATDANGMVYVVDELNHRIQKFDTDGSFVVQWGGNGTGDGQFHFPAGIAVDFYGTIYVADRFNHRIQKFVQATPCPSWTTQVASGVCFERKWGTFGSAAGDLAFPVAIAVEPPDAFGNVGNVYVTDAANYRIQVFTPSGTSVIRWGTQGRTGNSHFEEPWGIAIDQSRNVYVSDRLNNRVQKFGRFGNYLTEWGSKGTGNGQFEGPVGLDVDPVGTVFVVDLFNSRIQKFTSNGVFLGSYGHQGTAPDELRFPADIAVDQVDPFGRIHISDYANDRVQLLSYPDSDGDALLDEWEMSGIDINNDGIIDLNLPALGANPQHKDVFLEIDHLEFHAPPVQAMNAIVASYNNGAVSNPDGLPGVSLHISIDEQIPHQAVTSWSDFAALKGTYFGSSSQRGSPNAANALLAKKMVYRYALFFHSNCGFGGQAEVPGNDILVSSWGPDGTCPQGPDVEDVAGGFMHELGHNLGLHHGGGDQINCKPNYFSVMSYSWTYNWIKSYVSGYSRPLDYSREVNPQLNESSLFEPAGVATSSTSWLYANYASSSGSGLISAVNVPIDWNADGDSVDAGIAANANAANGACDGVGTVLSGFNDWANLVYNFRRGRFFLANVHPSEAEHPPDPTSDEMIAQILATAVLKVGVDINPNDASNSIRVTGRSIVPVAIKSDTFDATFVDPATVTFGPGAARAVFSTVIDVDRDGDRDLVLVFDVGAAGLVCGQTSATLAGRTFAGAMIEGADRFRPEPCR